MNELNSINVDIEIGTAYRPSGRVAAALEELQRALVEADDSEVEGFAGYIKFDGIDGEFRSKIPPVFKYRAVDGVPLVVEGFTFDTSIFVN